MVIKTNQDHYDNMNLPNVQQAKIDSSCLTEYLSGNIIAATQSIRPSIVRNTNNINPNGRYKRNCITLSPENLNIKNICKFYPENFMQKMKHI